MGVQFLVASQTYTYLKHLIVLAKTQISWMKLRHDYRLQDQNMCESAIR